MVHTIGATINERGEVHLLEAVTRPQARRALVTILEEPPTPLSQTALLSEAVLAVDWDRPEEDEAWSYLQSAE